MIAAGVLLVWCVIADAAALRAALSRGPDPMARLESEFLAFVPFLPSRGDIGYLEQHGGGDEAVRTYYAAQYALVPRVVIARVGPEFLIVPRDAAVPADTRLEGYAAVRTFPSGHRLFRRAP